MKKIISIILSLTLILSFMPILAGATTDNKLNIQIKDLNQTIKLGSTFEMVVTLSGDVDSLFSYELFINFDKDFLECTNIESTVSGIAGIKTIDNDNGTIDFAYCTKGYNLPSNRLVTMEFKVLKEGETSLSFDDTKTVLLRDAKNSPPDIEYNPQVCSIDLGAKPLTPKLTSPQDSKIYKTTQAKLKSDTEDAVIYYTTDDEIPTTSSSKYNGFITISKSTTIRAIAVKYGVSSEELNRKIQFVQGYTNSGGNGGSSTGYIYNPAASPIPTAPASPTVGFSDIENHWSKNYVQSLVDKKIINGYEDNTIKPDALITRAEATKLIVTAIGSAAAGNSNLAFADSSDIADWVRGYVQTAIDKGIMNGYEDNTFKPNQSVSRKELAVMAMKAFEYGEDNFNALNFTDGNDIASWAYGYIAKAVSLSIITGYEDNTFKADKPVTRAEACAIIYKCLEAK